MKKLIFPLSLIVIAAMLLAACGGTAGPNGAVTPGAGTGAETPSIMETPAGGTGSTTEATPTVEATTGATMEATTAATAEATTEATTAATSEATAEATATTSAPSGAQTTATVEATPSSGTGSTGTGTGTGTGSTGGTTGGATGSTTAEGQYVRLTSLLTANVSTKDNQQAGTVDGVLVEHPAPPPAASEGSATAAATPEATATSAVPSEKAQEFTVRYILVDTTGTKAASGAGTSSGSSTSSSKSTGNIAVIPWQAFDMTTAVNSGATLTLTAPESALAAAPHMRLSEIASPGGSWAGDVASYWTGQGVAGIPTTGDTGGVNTANLALIPREYRGITMSDQEGSQLGNIVDFVIDPRTGVIQSAIFNGGETFGNKTFAVPLTHLSWAGNSGTQLGGFQFNFPNDILKNAPALPSLDSLQLNQEWSTQLNQFWNSIQGSGSGSSK